MTYNKKNVLNWAYLAFILLFCSSGIALAKKANDPHYTSAGFFDLHVCNWPEEKLFFMAVFSTYDSGNIRSVVVTRPDGSRLGQISLNSPRVINTKKKKKKYVFIHRFVIGPTDTDGWYKAEIILKSGKHIIARDLVNLKVMPITSGTSPTESAGEVDIPEFFTWQKVPGAGFYKVTIRDMWKEGQVIHTSKLLRDNRYKVPDGLLKHGGWYKWQVNIRDVNEDIQLGDFNHGSLSQPLQFFTK